MGLLCSVWMESGLIPQLFPSADGAGCRFEENVVGDVDDQPAAAGEKGKQNQPEPVDMLAGLYHLLAIRAVFHDGVPFSIASICKKLIPEGIGYHEENEQTEEKVSHANHLSSCSRSEKFTETGSFSDAVYAEAVNACLCFAWQILTFYRPCYSIA